jgi:hypothetical protein
MKNANNRNNENEKKEGKVIAHAVGRVERFLQMADKNLSSHKSSLRS